MLASTQRLDYRKVSDEAISEKLSNIHSVPHMVRREVRTKIAVLANAYRLAFYGLPAIPCTAFGVKNTGLASRENPLRG